MKSRITFASKNCSPRSTFRLDYSENFLIILLGLKYNINGVRLFLEIGDDLKVRGSLKIFNFVLLILCMSLFFKLF